jgi:carboxyl-terminal processing protease
MKKILKKISIALLGVFILGSIAFQSDFFEIAKQIEIYSEVFKQLDMYYIDEISPAELNQIALKSMLKSLDPYTHFYDEQGIEDVRIKRSGEYGGIGSYTRYKDKRLFIIEPYKDSPATKAGLKAGDEILQIDDVIIKDYEEESVGNLLRGTPGTEVKVKILRQGKKKNMTIKREKIDINPVPFYGMVDKEVGYISLVKFNKKTSPEVRKAITDLKEQGMKKLVFDIRGNPGGLLSEAIAITNLFVPKGKLVVTTKSKVKKWSKEYKTLRVALDTIMPVVVLINDRSASASEIVSGSLQDYDRAVIMGERSYGKGLVQRYRKLTYGTQMKLTISKYYTPSGRCIQELDYTNMDKDGNVPKFSDIEINEFKTQNGRKVFDGGGVLPDVVIDKPKTLQITKALYQSDAFFNFITNYYYKNETIAEAAKFKLDDSVYESLKEYLLNHPKEFETVSEKEFDKAVDLTEKEGYKEQIQALFKSFKQAVATKKINRLDVNKTEILERLTEEIVKRYYYREGVFQQKLAFDPVVVQAKELLHNEKKYTKILM